MRRLASVFSSKKRGSTGHSSSSSSPDEDPPPLPKRSWKSWIGGKRSLSPKAKPPLPDWIVLASPDDDDDDATDDDDVPSLPPSPEQPIFKNTYAPPSPVPPFVQHSDGPLFPRSVNHPALLSPPPNTRVAILRSHLLNNSDHNPSPSPDISRPTSKIFPSSPGIRRWIARPCFEDRYAIFVPSTAGAVNVIPVSSTLAIAALEYSEHLDTMADPDFDHPEYDTIPPPTPQLSPSSSDPVLPAPSSRNSYTPAPSPLRNEHSPTPSLRSQKSEPVLNAIKSNVKRVVRFAEDDSDGEDGLPLHIIRMKKKREQKAIFLRQEQVRRTGEEGEERRHREQAARMLEEEAKERQQKRQALEREKREAEKLRYAETIAATRMRREIHKAGGVVSSNTTISHVSSPSFTSLRDSERNNPPTRSRIPHDPQSSLSIPRREASDSALPINSHSHTHYLSDSSPASSRPPSMSHSHSPVSPGSQDHHSRSPSTQSSSSEELRHQGGNRRSSLTAAAVAAHTSGFGGSPVIASYPMWSGSNPNIQYIPPVPQFPAFVHEMPLLPPAAPFMKHSYNPRTPLRNGSPASSSSNSRRGSYTSSTERVNQIPASTLSRDSSASRSPHLQQYRASPSSNSVKSIAHQRRGSAESRNTQATQSSSRPTPKTSATLPRGRPQQPMRSSTQYIQTAPPSTWMPLSPQFSPMQPMPMMVMVPAMVPAYPMNMNMMNLNANANGMVQQSNPRSGTSAGGSTNSKSAAHRWRQTQTFIS